MTNEKFKQNDRTLYMNWILLTKTNQKSSNFIISQYKTTEEDNAPFAFEKYNFYLLNFQKVPV